MPEDVSAREHVVRARAMRGDDVLGVAWPDAWLTEDEVDVARELQRRDYYPFHVKLLALQFWEVSHRFHFSRSSRA